MPENKIGEINSLLNLKDGTIAIGSVSRIEILNYETHKVLRTLKIHSESCLALLSNMSIVSSYSQDLNSDSNIILITVKVSFS